MTETTTPRPAARFIGQSVTRKEDQRLLTGHGQYVDDVVAAAACCTRAFLRSDIARATITSIDTSAAKAALPGVVARVHVAGLRRAASARRGTRCSGEDLVVPPPLAISDVRYVGDLGRPRGRREPLRRRGRVRADRGRLRAHAGGRRLRTAADDTENLVHGAWGLESNAMVACRSCRSPPTSTRRSQAAEHVVECTIEQNRYICVPMETRGIIASWTPGRDEMEIVCSTQSVHETRNFFAALPRHPRGNITVTARDVGGGFGQKMFVFREECAVVLAVALLGQPGEVDRGPPREPDRRRRTRATSSARCGWPSTTTASSRRSPSSTSPTSAPTRRARR